MLLVLNPAPEIRPFAVQYLRIVVFSLVASLGLNCCSSVARGMKSSQEVLNSTLVTMVVNGLLDAVLVLRDPILSGVY